MKMSKKKEETTIEEQQVTTQQKTGTFILEAPTREALQEQFEALKAEAPEGASIVTGAVGQKPDNRTFVLQVTINS